MDNRSKSEQQLEQDLRFEVFALNKHRSGEAAQEYPDLWSPDQNEAAKHRHWTNAHALQAEIAYRKQSA